MPFDSDEIWERSASRGALRHALYFSIYPPREIAEQVHRLGWRVRRTRGLRGRLIARERLHVSMNGIAASPQTPADDWIARAMAAADKVRMPAFRVAFDQVECWGERARLHPWVLTGGERVGFDLLHAELDGALRWHGRPRPGDQFNPHMTLLYDGRMGAEDVISPLTWRVEEFCLVHSLQGRGEHRVLGRWRLG